MVGGSAVAKHRDATLTAPDRGDLDVDVAAPRGGHADVQEHCNLFFQYYINDEAQGPLGCEEGSGGW